MNRTMQDCWLTCCGLAIGTGKRPARSTPALFDTTKSKKGRHSGIACLTSSGRGSRKWSEFPLSHCIQDTEMPASREGWRGYGSFLPGELSSAAMKVWTME